MSIDLQPSCLSCGADMYLLHISKVGTKKYACTICEYTEVVGSPKGRKARSEGKSNLRKESWYKDNDDNTLDDEGTFNDLDYEPEY